MGSRPWSERVQALAAGGVRLACRPVVVGLEHLPTGPFLGVANHPTPLDAGLIRSVLGRPVTCTDLLEGSEPLRSLEALGHGDTVIAFVEGHRSPDGAVHRGLPIVASLVLGTTVPVVPLAIRSPVDARGWFSPLGAAGPQIVIGEPLDLAHHRQLDDEFSGSDLEDLAGRTVVDTVVHALVTLSGRRYVDVDAARSRVELHAEAHEQRQARAAAARLARQEAELARARAQEAAAQEERQAAAEREWAEQAAREQAERAAREDAERLAQLHQERDAARRAGQDGS